MVTIAFNTSFEKTLKKIKDNIVVNKVNHQEEVNFIKQRITLWL